MIGLFFRAGVALSLLGAAGAYAEPLNEFVCASFQTPRKPVAWIRFKPPLTEESQAAAILVLPSSKFVLATIRLEGLEIRVDWANSEGRQVYAINVGPDVSRYYDFSDAPPDTAIKASLALWCTPPQPVPATATNDEPAPAPH